MVYSLLGISWVGVGLVKKEIWVGGGGAGGWL